MKSYDLVCILRPDLEADALKAAVDRLTKRITDQGGTLEAVAIWGKKRMAFAIKLLKTRCTMSGDPLTGAVASSAS